MARPREFDEVAVIDAAMETFWSHGYANTSPALLAEATGVAKGSLYNAFTSKRELFERALTRYDTVGIEVTQELLDRPGTTKQTIGDFLRFLVDVDVAGAERRGCLAVNTAIELAGHDPVAARRVSALQRHTISALGARIDRGRLDGDVSPELDTRACAEFLMNTIVGLRVMAKTQDRATLHRIIDSALATF